MPGIRRTGIFTCVLVLALSALIVACADEGTDDDAPTDVTEEAVDEKFSIHEVTVTDEGLEPGTVELRVPEKAELVVKNESATSCSFHFGPYVDGLHVPAGGSTKMAFVAADMAQTQPPDPDFLVMGCAEDGRRGEIVLLTSTAR